MNHDDRRLIAEVLAGRTPAYAELVRRYQNRSFSVVLRMLDNAEDAADVATSPVPLLLVGVLRGADLRRRALHVLRCLVQRRGGDHGAGLLG